MVHHLWQTKHVEERGREEAHVFPETGTGSREQRSKSTQRPHHHALTLHFLKMRKCNQKSSLPEQLYRTGPPGTWPRSCPYLLPVRGDLFWSQPRPAGQGEWCQLGWGGDVTSLTLVPPGLGPGSAQMEFVATHLPVLSSCRKVMPAHVRLK